MDIPPDNRNPTRIREILKRSLVLENTSPTTGRFTLFCRTPEKLGIMVEWLATQFPDKFPCAKSIVDDLNTLGTNNNVQKILEDPDLAEVYDRVSKTLDIMQVDLPERIGRTKAAIRNTGCDPCPQETVHLFGIVLPSTHKTHQCSEVFERLKQFRLAECNVARIDKYDQLEQIVVNRLLEQDNLRTKS